MEILLAIFFFSFFCCVVLVGSPGIFKGKSFFLFGSSRKLKFLLRSLALTRRVPYFFPFVSYAY